MPKLTIQEEQSSRTTEAEEKEAEAPDPPPKAPTIEKKLHAWYLTTLEDSRVTDIPESCHGPRRSQRNTPAPSVHFGLVAQIAEPRTFVEARDSPEWQRAMETELEAILRNETWDLV